MNAKKILLNGILHENPTFRLVLGMCPTLAITYQASNGIAHGAWRRRLCSCFPIW